MKIQKINKQQQAIWNESVIAESNVTLTADGYIYFPPETVKKEFLVKSEYHSYCPWKGEASYYNIIVNKKVNQNAAWYYPEPFEKAHELKNWIGFWKGVAVNIVE